MLSRNKLYVKKEPYKDARLFIIFCEGEKTEPNYFRYFNSIASQIRIELVPHVDGKNSPLGLYETACKLILSTPDNPSPKYDIRKDDEIWFVIDTDLWGDALIELREKASQQNWLVAQSYPCFEVWLYYHFQNIRPSFADMGVSKNWKKYLNETHGGFNTSKHPIHLEVALTNAKANFSLNAGAPEPASTEVYLLAEKILPLVKSELDTALAVNSALLL